MIVNQVLLDEPRNLILGMSHMQLRPLHKFKSLMLNSLKLLDVGRYSPQ